MPWDAGRGTQESGRVQCTADADRLNFFQRDSRAGTRRPSCNPLPLPKSRARTLFKLLVTLVLLAALVYGGPWLAAGRMAGPLVEIRQPDRFIGQSSPLELVAEAPEGRFSRLDVTLEQNGQSFPIFSLDQPSQATTRQDTADRLYVM